MLILTRREGDEIVIGDDIVIRIAAAHGQVRLGIKAPEHVEVHRREIYDQIQKENKKNAS